MKTKEIASIPPLQVRKLLDKGEGECLDYKKEVSNESKIAKTMVSFANHKGGKLLIGVNDNRTINGISAEEEKFMLEKAAGFYCRPEITISIREWQVGKKTVLEVDIPRGDNKPYFALGEDGKWWAYIRVNDESLLASKVVLDVLKRESTGAQTLISFSSKEKALMEYLSEHRKITLPQFTKLVNISRRRATIILVNMISIGVIRAHNTEKTEFYTLS
ncbi:MAG: putative DNA binding domain-containing protein [Bacteroidota bacterium]|nr:putative DNA binding domain-containing protein [Bacteroidota bacterium]